MSNSLIGQTLGQYKIISELGRGQHSVVYKAWQPSLERHVTLKVLRRYDQEILQKFQVEARLTAYLIQQGVPNIREVYEVGQTAGGLLYVALQFIEDSLRHLLHRMQGQRRLMDPTAAANLLKPVALALDAIHSLGWVHLDIKPHNILITREGRTILADFGIAQRRGGMTHACTPTYASPEQAAGDRPIGPWSDIYSLGVVYYEMIAGHPPVRGDHDIVLLNQHLEVTPPSPSRVNPALSSTQERALFKALAKSPKQRPRTAGDFVHALLSSEGWLSSVIQTPVQVLDANSRRIRRIPRPILIGGVLLVALILILAVWALWPRSPSPMPVPTSAPAQEDTATAAPSPTPIGEVVPPVTPTSSTAPASVPLPTTTLAPTFTPAPRPTATAVGGTTLDGSSG